MAGNQVAWGIDVGVSSLKALKLRRDGDRVSIEAFELIEHDKFLTEPDADRDTLIRSTLQKFMSKYAVKREAVYIGVPGSTTFARFVKLPPVENRKIPEIVRFEAIQQIPFPLDQVNWDYHTFQSADSPEVEVGIFAMKKELVAQVMANFRSVGLSVQGVQMSPLAVYNAAAYDGMTQDKGTVVIDMGAEHTDLVIMDQGRLWLRTINIGGNHFTDALAKSFKQPFARAETLKKTAATSKYQKQIYQAMRPIFSDLVSDIQRSIGHYNQTHRDSRLEHIIVMGNPFKLPNLQKYLQQELKMDVERLETFKMANVDKAAAFSENILSMTAAYGLAVQALGLAPINTNLLPPEIARAMMWKKKQPWFIGSTALLAVGALAIGWQYYSAKASYAKQADAAAQNDQTKQQYETQIQQWKSVNDDYDNSKKLVTDEFKLLAARNIWPMLRNDILSALPQAQGKNESIVVTQIDSQYTNNLSSLSTAVAGSAMTPGAPAAGPAPAGANPWGPSDHGFLITINGYSRSGSYQTASNYMMDIMKKADKNNKDKPYYFEYDPASKTSALTTSSYGGHVIGRGGGLGMGGGLGGGGGSGNDKPWGNATGAFRELFAPEIIGVPATGPGSSTPAAGADLALDFAAMKREAGKPLAQVPMAGSYTFTIRFKVHVKDDLGATN